MDSDTIDEVTGWDSTSASQGYRGLHELADASFSGAITDGVAWAFMLNGNVIGVFDGTVEEFEDAELSAYRAPDDALPLLFTMRETGGETRAQYYTNDTPLSEADQTLTSGGFTGYVELSENVLSGDYYVVYHGGKSMSVAFIGNSRKLLTGEEAFQRADGEVGIYQVRDVDVEVVELPESDVVESERAAASGGASADEEDDSETGQTPETEHSTHDDETETEPIAFGEGDSTDESVDGAGQSTDGETAEATTEEGDAPSSLFGSSSDDPDAVGDDFGVGADAPDAVGSVDEDEIESDAGDGVSGDAVPESASETDQDETVDRRDVSDAEVTDGTASTSAGEAASSADVFAEEAEWRDAQAIPALSPDESDPEATGDAPSDGETVDTQSVPGSARSPPTGGGDADFEAVAERLGAVQRERDEYREEAARLGDRIDELEAELARLRSRDGGGEALTPAEAREGTNLFVRYHSKSDPTLASAHDGEATREAVAENLRLEYHTRFEAEDVSVDGDAFEEFLFDSVEYGFVRWIVEDLLFEIAETGNRNTLGDLFDAIPEIDRAELSGTISVEYAEDGETHREQQRFDVVLRNRMGNPLLVANINDSRAAASEEMLRSLVGDAKRGGESNDSLTAACHVTSSYFEPEALEVAAEETGGGLFSRSKRKSFVKLSRKQGFHLCLVETRDGDFHMSVPDL